VQIRSRFFPGVSRKSCKLGSQRLFVFRWEWETLCPAIGPFPHFSHTRDIFLFDSSFLLVTLLFNFRFFTSEQLIIVPKNDSII
jgi:hypothetical protein